MNGEDVRQGNVDGGKAAPDDYRTPAERVSDLPRILDAMEEGVRQALRRHKALGNPIAIWKDGAVVWIPPEEILPDEPSTDRGET
ncbi:MAG: hypothetical protein KJ067_18570 [Vicinamibacteria bacterium]|nr:hypothetical protein [Vicinamibacteria bacterium]